VEGSIASRNARGGTAGDRVAEQLDDLHAIVTAARAAFAIRSGGSA
jgi:argininosuccinate lyase